MNKRRPCVLILGSKEYPAFVSKQILSGGMEKYVTETASELSKRGFDVKIITETDG